MYGQAVDPIDPEAALAAYREAVTYFDPVADRPTYMSCKALIGFGLEALGKFTPPESEELIACLETALEDFPDAASTLATYYTRRGVGDPLENWKKRTHYLDLALAQLSPAQDLAAWAALKTQLVDALSQQPDGDFASALEARIAGLKDVLSILDPFKTQAGSPAQSQWILVSTELSEAYLSRPGSDQINDRLAAMGYARDAYAACGPLSTRQTRAFATLALARALLNEDGEDVRADNIQGLDLCHQAEALLDRKTQPVPMATALKFTALAHLRFLKAGEPGHLDDLLRAADAAFALLDPVLYSGLQRVVMQVAADGLLTSNEYLKAVPYLERAVAAGERTLERATTQAARLEGIFDMSDTCARLGFCLFQAGLVGRGIEALDRGKGRLWRPSSAFATFDQIRHLVPGGGALLFPAFAPQDGAIAIVTGEGEAVCQLPGFGRDHLKQLLLGDILNPDSSSWIPRYICRGADPERWRETIDAIGGLLFNTIWDPVINSLTSLGVEPGAELVWFPQAGLGVLPLHAAWKGAAGSRTWIPDLYAVRYAPSASCLLGNPAELPGASTLIVSDPAGDLKNSALELAWVRQAHPPGSTTVLTGAAATRQQVVAQLQQVQRAHFSTHAVFRVDDPFKSGLLMANGELLLLEDLLPLLKEATLRDVILSACETGMAQVARRPDELLGFPAAFLEHGAKSVIATQWPVDDWAAAALIGRFYREAQTPGCTSAQALRKAQTWMRQVTVAELRDLLKPLRDDPPPVGGLASQLRSSLGELDKQQRPFAHPYFWAPFTLSGS